MLRGVHLELPAVEGRQSPAERTEPHAPGGVLGNAHHHQMGQAMGQPEVLEEFPVEPAHSAIGRGDPELTSPVLAQILDPHPGQSVPEGVVARPHVSE